MKTYTYNKSTVWFLSTPILLSYFTKSSYHPGLYPGGLFLFKKGALKKADEETFVRSKSFLLLHSQKVRVAFKAVSSAEVHLNLEKRSVRLCHRIFPLKNLIEKNPAATAIVRLNESRSGLLNEHLTFLPIPPLYSPSNPAES